ncbi:monocarboxylate transporter 12-B-like [Amphiura filiformis]|uniref:monocarboxylate transporter 12-B-like n=1 Tax=Amphiura filiformis TaxID=82378 RepID=UPI003B2223F4
MKRNKKAGASRLQSADLATNEKSHHIYDAADVDTAWRWVVVLGSHLCHQLVWGMFRSTGVLLVEWKMHFGTGAAVVSSVASVMSASLLLTGPVAGFLCKRYGCRLVTILGGILVSTGILLGSQARSILHLCISVGGITGMGFSLSYTASAVIPGHYFDKHFALANGISCAGTGVGVMIIPPLVQVLIGYYGWRGAMIVMSTVLMNICVCGAVFRPIPPSAKRTQAISGSTTKIAMNNSNSNGTELKEKEDLPNTGFAKLTESSSIGEKDQNGGYIKIATIDTSEPDTITGKQPFSCSKILVNLFKATGFHIFGKSYRFFVLCLTQMLVGLSFSGVLVHIVNHIGLVCENRSSVEVSLILSVIGTGSLVARAGHGFLVDRHCLTPMIGYSIGIVVGSITILFSPLIKGYMWFAVFGAVLGTSIGLNMSLLRVLVKEFLSLKDLAQGIGLSAVVFFGTGDLIGPLLSGWLYDITGNYTVSFFVMGGLLSAAGPLMLLIVLLRRFDLRHKGLEIKEVIETKV